MSTKLNEAVKEFLWVMRNSAGPLVTLDKKSPVIVAMQEALEAAQLAAPDAQRIADLEQTVKNQNYARQMLLDRIAELEAQIAASQPAQGERQPMPSPFCSGCNGFVMGTPGQLCRFPACRDKDA